MFRNRCCGNLVRPRVKLKPCNRVTMEGNTCCQQVRNLPRPPTNREQLRTGGVEFFPRHARSTDALSRCRAQPLTWTFFFLFLRIHSCYSFFFCSNRSFKLRWDFVLRAMEVEARWKILSFRAARFYRYVYKIWHIVILRNINYC